MPFFRSLGNSVRQSPPDAGLGPFNEAPVSYFAPEPRLAAGTDPDSAARELKQVIAALHREGIEVLLQVSWPSTSAWRLYLGILLCPVRAAEDGVNAFRCRQLHHEMCTLDIS